MDKLRQILTRAGVLPALPELSGPGRACYLVGGALRDLLLEREVKDFDFATPGDPTKLAQAFARAIKGRWFMLDAERKQSRVVVKTAEAMLGYDFAPFRGEDLEADLRGRDFTVNALACHLEPQGAALALHDLLGGRGDLEKRLLRACAEGAFADDPLRVLRGVRHAVQLGFSIEPGTFGAMSDAAPQVGKCAPERVREELAATLNCEAADSAYPFWQQLGVMQTLFGPGGKEATRTDQEALRHLSERGLRNLDEEPTGRKLLQDQAGDGFTRAGLLRLAACLRWRKTEELRTVLAERLRLSRRNVAVVESLVGLQKTLETQLRKLPAKPRARALWAETLGPGPVEALLFLALISEPSVELRQALLVTSGDYLDLCSEGQVPDLLDGSWIKKNLSLKPGPVVGKLLQKVRAEEIAGRIQTREQAVRFLAEEGKKIVDKG
ncbi:cytidine(C)-cytidine(C)-adenosine (A)]-adding enzyme [Desulfuromonas versatilis]|uniref:Cytidine(C)-cytidine(C)-adenosine (A)]-adding enzyme n=1 Tax=Desulfuromonas versatilis TaxID=2802975 RepID=A0ABN6DZM6_9BACT|nr:hypothetical protein [Desulfuromonas versatilis]BCR04974.1 cytidine(C)-cytidine(C)-adenosine (A)]-adding enzyme [Desulfuromonas versatilis]